MIKVIFGCLLLMMSQLYALETFDPTLEELSRSATLKVLPHWGVNLRKERSLRLLALGGSNTANNDYFYVKLLKDQLEKHASVFGKNAYIINGGVSGRGPVTQTFAFETTLPLSDWPNAVSLEYCVNLDMTWDAAQEVDVLINSMRAKWMQRGLPPPAIFFIELLKVRNFYPPRSRERSSLKPFDKSHTVLDHSAAAHLTPLTSSSPTFNRGGGAGSPLLALARFYGYPFISYVDAMWPSFVRFYSSFGNSTMWPYLIDDGAHLSEKGARTLVENMLIPFLTEEMSPHRTDYLYEGNTSIYPVDIRMFPFDRYEQTKLEKTWSSWGSQEHNSLDRIIMDPARNIGKKGMENSMSRGDWSMMDLRGHHDGAHRCYGATMRDAVARLGVEVEMKGSHVSVELIHSWNTSYVGRAHCAVLETDRSDFQRESMTVVGEVKVFGDEHHGKKIHDTTPRMVHITTEETPVTKRYVLVECTNLEEGKLTCISGLRLYSIASPPRSGESATSTK